MTQSSNKTETRPHKHIKRMFPLKIDMQMVRLNNYAADIASYICLNLLSWGFNEIVYLRLA